MTNNQRALLTGYVAGIPCMFAYVCSLAGRLPNDKLEWTLLIGGSLLWPCVVALACLAWLTRFEGIQ